MDRQMAMLNTSARGAIKRKMSVVNNSHLKVLFSTRKMVYSTGLLLILWGMLLGMLIHTQVVSTH